MSGFTDRSLNRALGMSGRIQPRIAPITAPDPYVMSGSPSSLESVEELEARPELGGRRRDLRAGGNVLEEHAGIGDEVAVAARRPDRRPNPERGVWIPDDDRARRGRSPEPAGRSVALREPALAEPVMQSESEPLEVLERPAKAHPSELPSFRVRGLRQPTAEGLDPLVRRSLAAASHPTLEREQTIVGSSAALRGPELGPMADARGREVSPVVSSSQPASQPIREALARRTAPSRRAADSGAVAPVASTPTIDPDLPAALDIASMRASRRSTAAPIVRVEIGKVEVRAAQPAREPARPIGGIAKPATFVSLQQYLHKRGAP